MAEAGIRNALETHCGVGLRYFELVNVTYMDRAKKLYLAIGRHSIFLLKRSLARMITGGEIFFLQIDKFIEDTRRSTDLVLELNGNRHETWEEPRVWLTSVNRAKLLNFLKVAFLSDHIFRTSRTRLFPHYRHPMSTTEVDNEYPLVVPFIGCRQVKYGLYRFFLSKAYQDLTACTAGIETGTYRDSQGTTIHVNVSAASSLLGLERTDKTDIKWIAQTYRNQELLKRRYCVNLKNDYYVKKMNLSSDIAQWTGWQLLFRDFETFTYTIILRRQYIPPLMDTCEDIIITGTISLEDQMKERVTDESFIRSVQFVSDTFSTEAQNHVWYKDIVQANLDALLYNEDGYQYLESRLKMRPAILQKAKILLKSVLVVLYNDHLLDSRDLIEEIGDDVDMVEDPLHVIEDCIRYMEEIGLVNPTIESLKIQNRWEMRLARYLGYSVHYVLLEDRFTILDMVDALDEGSESVREMIHYLLRFFLHVRSPKMEEPFGNRDISKEIEDLSSIPGGAIYNHHILEILLDNGYIAKLFVKGEEDQFITLMGRLVRSTSCPVNLRLTICQQLVKASASSSVAHERFIPCMSYLTDLLSCKDMKVSSYSVASVVVATLVNLSAGSLAIKNALINLDVPAATVTLLRRGVHDLAEHCLALTINLTKLPHHRKRFLGEGLLHIAADFFITNLKSQHEQGQKIISHLAAILGQLSNSQDARTQLCLKYPIVDGLLYLYHRLEAESEFKSRVIFCLKQLSTHSWELKERVGRHCIATALLELSESPSVDYVATNLIFIQVLLKYKKNYLEIIRADGLNLMERAIENTNMDTIFERVETIKSTVVSLKKLADLSGDVS